MLLCDGACLKDIVFQFLFGTPGVQHEECHQKHSLVLALQFFQQGFGITAIGRQIGRNDVNIIPGADCFLLLLNLASIKFSNRALDRFNGAVLVNALNVHGDNLAGIHIQKIFQKLVADVGGRDAQKTGGTVDSAHLERPGIFEGESSRCNGIFHRKAAFHEIIPFKTELRFTVHVEHIVHELEPFRTIQRLGLNTQTVEVVEQIVLHMVEPCFHLTHTLALHAKGDELGLSQTIIALGKLLAQHQRILSPHIIETVFLEWNADAFLEF